MNKALPSPKSEPKAEEKAAGRYDVEREARRADGVREKVGRLREAGREDAADEALNRGERRLKGALAMEVANAESWALRCPRCGRC